MPSQTVNMEGMARAFMRGMHFGSLCFSTLMKDFIPSDGPHMTQSGSALQPASLVQSLWVHLMAMSEKKSMCMASANSFSEMNPSPPGADELSQKIRDFLAAETDFYIIVQSACDKEQIMDTKTMNN